MDKLEDAERSRIQALNGSVKGPGGTLLFSHNWYTFRFPLTVDTPWTTISISASTNACSER